MCDICGSTDWEVITAKSIKRVCCECGSEQLTEIKVRSLIGVIRDVTANALTSIASKISTGY